MLVLNIDEEEVFDEEAHEFRLIGGFKVRLEHSLVSMSKWESIYQKPFLGTDKKSEDEIRKYVEMMLLDEIAPEDFWKKLKPSAYESIVEYIDSKQSATTFNDPPSKSRGRPEVITSELIYYWMVAFNIPFECETWHLNRLFALIRICNLKNGPKNKRSKQEIARNYRELNAQRRAQLGTSG